jgi:hypothetical protein
VDAKGDIVAASANDTPARLAVGSNGETLVADSSTSTGLRYQGSQVAGRNCIINGGMDIWQRGITFSGSQYGADRWFSSSGSNAYTITRETGISSFQYALKLTQTGSNSFTQIGTQIEFANCYLLQNQAVTISFYAQANNTNAGSTTLTVRTRTIAGVDGACLFAGTASSENKTITTSPVRYSVTKTLPATFGSLSLEFSTGAGVTGDGFTITGIQMELGSVASAFSRTGGTIQGELAACQRYYYRSTASALNTHFCAGFGLSSTSIRLLLQNPVQMRAAATSIDYSNLQVGDGNTTVSVTNLVIGFTGFLVQTLTATVASGGTQFRPFNLFDSTGTGYVGISAEL